MLGRISGRFALVAFAVLLSARPAAACSGRTFESNDLVENTPDFSSNGRFAAVVRWYENVPDFGSVRAGTLFGLDEPEPLEPVVYFDEEPPPVEDEDEEEEAVESATYVEPPRLETVTTALYEIGANGRRLIAEIPIPREELGYLLVSDSGQYIVAAVGPGTRGCYARAQANDPVVAIYTSTGTRVARLDVEDILTPSDILVIQDYTHFSLRHESDTREVVVIGIPAPSPNWEERRYVELRVDVKTGELLDPKRNIYPQQRVYVTPVTAADVLRPYDPQSPECAAAFETGDLVPVDSAQFFEQATFGPLPALPEIARKARIRGTVRVEVVVSETGHVLCARNTPLPFGLAETANKAIQQWRFEPPRVDGRPAKMLGELVVHFEDVDEETWNEMMRTAPPRGE